MSLPQDEFEGKALYQAKGYVTQESGYFEYKRFSCKKMCSKKRINLLKLLSACIRSQIQTQGYRRIREVQLLSTVGNPPGNMAAVWVLPV